MGQQVIQADRQLLRSMEKHYAGSIQSPPQGAVFQAKTSGCTVTAYQSGKVLFQGKRADAEASKWGRSSSGAVRKKTAPVSHRWAPPADIRSMSVIGSDETGTGDYFGPMTVVAVHLTKEQLQHTEELGLRDSKTITDPEIRQTAPKLLKQCTYSLTILRNEKYNELQQQGMNQGRMKALLHHEAIKGVIRKLQESSISYDGVFIDQFVKPEGYFNYLKQSGKQWPDSIPIYFATKAEDMHPAVAAGSILARYAFLQEMDKLAKKLGVPVPKGAGPRVDQAARDVLRLHGEETLRQSVKWHFSNTDRVIRS
ncbi:ribonuclease HIII [Alkalicoccus luteus]|uniref:Ribonuclease HIII n=1 Tax=Alkalicoccus luteus TaxID=1237094 RepID=A0A969PM25_9BACI|nr:ribonuclease HIII [Alkalicoccus luteus]NJP36695.1 ribonuclease HIII [Alkalicoccus luteus]